MNEASTVAKLGASGKVGGFQVAGIDAVHHHHPGIVHQLGVQLMVPHVHRVDAARAVLEQAIGEAAGGGARIQTDFVLHAQLEMLEGALQLFAAPAHETLRRFQIEHGVGGVGMPGFARGLAGHLDLAGADEALRALAAVRQPALHHQLIQSYPCHEGRICDGGLKTTREKRRFIPGRTDPARAGGRG
jgi:hypothetical protein